MQLKKFLPSFSIRRFLSRRSRTKPTDSEPLTPQPPTLATGLNPGMLGLCDPVVNPEDADIDIVFVHGLHGDRFNTWVQDGCFWPKDFLSADLPKTRIFSFGYHAELVNFFGDVSQNQIYHHASDLITQLQGFRSHTDTSNRPIILVAHSLGGLICEQAIHSFHDAQEEGRRTVARSIRKIAFLGTPHEGSDKAAWGEIARRFARLFTVTNPSLLSYLGEHSELLLNLERDFQHFLRHNTNTEKEVEVMCFTEGLPTVISGVNMGYIVTKKSASYAAHPTISLHADHRSMCKFKTKDDENYQRILSVLKGWVKAPRDSPERELEHSPHLF
ncbi:Alpha/Beta hydrolase protein [Hypomontagnella monticulosa]|nr:Alpha/Beta hydrolase protein [Hypomontagnella monticulosa]